MNWLQLKTAFPVKQKTERSHAVLISEWGKKVLEKSRQANREKVTVLETYPRPQMVRLEPAGRYKILNGWWKCAIVPDRRVPQKWDMEILVPFSPETLLSGVERQLKPGEYLWYEREITISNLQEGRRMLLHFGAVDQNCEIYLNGRRIGRHRGGYLPFSLDVTDRIRCGRNVLRLCVQDVSDTSYYSCGKQRLSRGGMFYTASSGIWQTVWMEEVPSSYIEQVWITPCYDDSMFDIRLRVCGEFGACQTGTCTKSKESILLLLHKAIIDRQGSIIGAEVFNETPLLREMTIEADTIQIDERHQEFHLKLQVTDKKSWTPENPWMYGLQICIGDDMVSCYAAMRCFTVEKDGKHLPRLCLNHQPCFMNGVLDQGYWPESLLTPPGDEAMISDIRRMKKMGFNMIRKHCKLEPQRWYYHCDHIGMIVWQDMVNGGSSYNMMKLCYLPTGFPNLFGHCKDRGEQAYKRTGRESKEGRRQWILETKETIQSLYNHPSIAAWILFNEGWGQFDSEEACLMARELDETRLIDHASGWFDQGAGDMRSVHNYFRPLTVEKGPRPFVISEYGGYAFRPEGHLFNQKVYGYGLYKNQKELQVAFEQQQRRIKELYQEGLCAAVYTQVSDIEDEVNGILSYDRAIWKIIPIKNLENKN